MRVAYVKQANAAAELQRMAERASAELQEGGPDAYVEHVVRFAGGAPTLLLSTHFSPTRNEDARWGNVRARSLYWHARWLRPFGRIHRHPVGTLAPRTVGALRIFSELLLFRPQRVLCWASSLPLWAAFLAARLGNASFVYSRHNRVADASEPGYLQLTRRIDQWIMRHSDAVICNGPYLADQLRAAGVSEARLVQFNWNFRHLWAEQPTLEAPPTQKKTVLFIGRLQESKGVFDLLEALAPRLAEDEGVELVYAGDGGDMDRLRRRLEALRLSDRVRLLGRVPHAQLAELIRASVAVVTPTRRWFPEGRCMATLEGLVMGRPVIAPNFGPFPYAVRDGVNGLLFEPDSVPDLRRTLTSLLDDPILYQKLSAGARESASEIRGYEINYGKALKLAFEIADPADNACSRAQQKI